MVTRSSTPDHNCPRTILDLIERFELHADAYRRQEYNETQVRREFIDPFFKTLGWDVDRLRFLFQPFPNQGLAADPVSTRVNFPAHDDAECLRTIA